MSEEIRPLLDKFPFEMKGIQINYFLIDINGLSLNDPYISIAQVSRNELSYQILVDVDDIPSLKYKYTEQYVDALKALNSEK